MEGKLIFQDRGAEILHWRMKMTELNNDTLWGH
jgi:hypothetical protein